MTDLLGIDPALQLSEPHFLRLVLPPTTKVVRTLRVASNQYFGRSLL